MEKAHGKRAFLLFVYRDYAGGDWLNLPQAAQFPIDLIRIERLRIETVPDPFQVFVMLRMIGVVDRLQQVLISDCSAYVFWWAGAGAHKANRVTHTFLRRKNAFNKEFMRPQVAEIVLVRKPRGLT